MKHRIAVIPGDGIGKEVVPEGMRVLEAAARRYGFELEWTDFDWSCEGYARTGRMMPEDGLDRLRALEAIFLGAVGFLLATGLWIFATAAGGGYSAVAAVHELIVASAATLVGAVVLVLKPPAARRVAALLLVTAYPLVLFGLALAGSILSSAATRAGR